MTWQRFVALAALVAAAATLTGCVGQTPASLRIYIFDNGAIRGLDPALFNFTREELEEVDFVNTSYLIVHPRAVRRCRLGVGRRRCCAIGRCRAERRRCA
jgi:hypothetical protein